MTTNIPEDSERRLRWFKKLIDPAHRCMNLRSYVKKLFNRKLEKNQYFVLRDMLDPKIRNIYYSTARQAGKTEVIAIFQALAALFPDCVIPFYEGKGHCYVFAPKQEQAQISFERFSNLIHYNDYALYPPEEFLVDRSDRLTFKNGFEVRAITASRNAEIEGLTTHIIILDESQHISPFKVRECLTGDTIIPLANGSYSTLKEVVENKLTVLTSTGEAMPIKHFEYDEDDIYEITLTNGKVLRCNDNHSHLVFNRDWKNTRNSTRRLNTLELKSNDRLAFIDKLPYFGKEGDYVEGFILGSMLGDGSFTDSAAPSFVGTADSIEILDIYINNKFQINSTKQKKTKSQYVNTVSFIGKQPGIKNSNKLTEYLRDLRLWNKIGSDKFIPNKAWSKRFLKGMISGLIETDGSICIADTDAKKDGRIKGTIEFTNKALGIIKPLQDYLLKFGIHCSIKNDNNRKGKGNCYTLTIKSVEDIRRFHKEFQLTSKQIKLEKLIHILRNKKGRNSSKYYSKDLRYIQIKSIKKLDKKEKVYCIQVENPNLWIANGIVTGNSILPMGGGVVGGGKVIQCGLPGILGSHFHRAYKNKYDAKENPYGYVHHIYPWTECPRVLRNENYVMGLKAQDTESFERNYELNWARNNFGYFLQEDQYEACEEEYDPIELRKKAVEKGWEIHWGIDFAKLKDSTVLTEMVLDPETEEFYLVRLIELKGVDYIVQIGYFAEMYNPSEIVHISVDQSSIGEVNVELMQSKSMNTSGEVFSIQKKEMIYKNYKHYIESHKVHWPKDKCVKSKEFKKLLKRFKQQLMELETEHRLTGHTSYHCNQNDNLARDDFPDSSGLCIWSATQYVPPEVGYLE